MHSLPHAHHTHTHFTYQDKRISSFDALYHPFLEDGRIRYHSCLCACCHTSNNVKQFCCDLEPSSPIRFDPAYEKELTSVPRAKGMSTVYIVNSK